MKKLQAISTVFVLAMFLAVTAFAGETETKSTDTTAAKDKKVELKEQTNCPVMGGKINKKYYADVQGQRVYFCCPGCSEKLLNDPDKYFQEAAAQGVLFENIQTTCPVTGNELKSKDVYTDYEGRRVYFCCAGCIPGLAWYRDAEKE
jgi:YHS domain-containing protein